jgi:hypothetical protein
VVHLCEVGQLCWAAQGVSAASEDAVATDELGRAGGSPQLALYVVASSIVVGWTSQVGASGTPCCKRVEVSALHTKE